MKSALRILSRYLKKESKGISTILTYEEKLGYFLKWLECEHMDYREVKYVDILSYVKELKRKGKGRRGNSKKTINQNLVALEHFYEGLKELEGKKNPVKSIRVRGVMKNKVEEILSEKELSKLYELYEGKGIIGLRNKCIIGMMVYQGLRSKELSGLKLEDVDLRKGKIWLRGNSISAGRELELQSVQILVLSDYIKAIKKNIEEEGEVSNALYLTKGGKRLKLKLIGILQILQRIKKDLKSLDQLRSSVISNWMKVYNIIEVQYKSGHKLVSSTQRYEQKDLKSLQKRISELHPLSQRTE